MANDVKRLNYFKGQFLRENDFLDEQTYHVQHQREHARLLHTPGIASGLDVPMPAAGSTAVTVQAGVGYDDQGRRIVLANNLLLELATFAAGQPVFVTITYDEQPSDPTTLTGISGSTRFTEKPIVAGSTTAPTDPNQLLLAKVNRTGATVATIDVTGRLNAGVKGGDLNVSGLTVSSSTVTQSQWPSVRTTGPLQATLTGSLQVNGTLGANVLAANLVNTTAIANLAVTNAKLADASVTTAKVLDGSITTAKILEAAVTTAKIADNSITSAKIPAAAVTLTQIADGNVGNTKLANAAITEPKIADLSISTRVLQDNSVTAAKILDGSVGTAEVANLAVTAAKIADLNVTTSKLADASVTTSKLADASVTTSKLTDASVTANKVADDSLPFRKLNSTLVWDISSATISASGTFNRVVIVGPGAGGIIFVEAWGLSTSANFSWSMYSITDSGTPPNVNTGVSFKNNQATVLTFAFRIWLINTN